MKDAAAEERKGEGASEEGPLEAPLPGEGTPAGRALREAHAAFEAGDFRAVRQLTAGIADSEDAEVVEAARALRARVSVDSVQVAILLLCVALFVGLTLAHVP